MNCYACGTETQFQCRRCGKPYCEQHGTGPFCAACLEPASLLPSPAVFRGTILALLVGSVIAFWLLLRPPSLPEDGANGSAAVRTPVPTATSSDATPTPPTATDNGGTSPSPVASPSPTPTASPGSATQYVVQPGDTLSGIAQQFGTTTQAIAAANNISDPTLISVGQTLTIPAAQ